MNSFVINYQLKNQQKKNNISGHNFKILCYQYLCDIQVLFKYENRLRLVFIDKLSLAILQSICATTRLTGVKV